MSNAKRILIVSDTHRKNDNYFRVLEKEAPLDLIIHCGDVEGSEYALTTAASCPVEMVAGNNDVFCDLPMERELRIGRYKVWVTHGHHYYISMGYDIICQEAASRGVDIVMVGHTHRPVIETAYGVTLINPGSLSYPRQEGKKPSYVLMEINEKGEADFTLKYL